MKPILLAALLTLTGAPATVAGARTCSEWQAVYLSPADDAGGRVEAAFGPADGSNPLPFTLTGLDDAGRRSWRFETIAWCFLGSGGCHIDVTLQRAARSRGRLTSDTPLRLLFARSRPQDRDAVPDILVLSGLDLAFLGAQRALQPEALAIARYDGSTEPVMPPQVFYFDRCIAD